jgi:hypothetical protein
MQKPLALSRVIAAPVDKVRETLMKNVSDVKGLVITGGPDVYQARLDYMAGVHLEGTLSLAAQGPASTLVEVNGTVTAPRLLLMGRDVNGIAAKLFDELERVANGGTPDKDVDLGL